MERDRRLWPRYRPALRVAVALEAAAWRVMGQLGNVSMSGLRLSREWGIDCAKMTTNTPVTVEWLIDGQLVKMPGRVVRVCADFVSVHFDYLLEQAVFQQLVLQSQACALQWMPDRVIVHGVLGYKIVSEILVANQAKRIVDLRFLRKMDGAGLGISRLIIDRQGTLDRCHPDIRATLDQGGICGDCQGRCAQAGRRVGAAA